MKGHSRSTLFLIEQLVVILIFSVCSAVCITIFVESYLISKRTLEINHAVRVAGNAAERYKAAGGNIREGDGVIYYDGNWDVSTVDEASFVLLITGLDNPAPALARAEITVSRIDGDELYRITVAARGDRR
ncbi:MAG: hypothetical protein FWE90_04130 [Defluviitaleaceae bacterium]|nr:hypothetical protein [Defluviitaleaceae bacterium]